MKVTVEQAYAACKVGRITRDEPNVAEVTAMQQRLQSFADNALPEGCELHVENGQVIWRQPKETA
ncbi:hypothetical protein [Dyella sp. ASV21]|uniref:hypothetical protein n=1 Tax=Dyella sp. ASV21 TaxID=2795114 RepID=UPI0018EC627E|nr:hypothetical protein [Dyella sp. ASV21]